MLRARRISTIPAAVAVVALLALGCASSGDAGDPDRIPWDQDAVTKLAQQFTSQVTALREAVLKDPSMRQGRTQNQHAANQYLESLRGLEQSSRQLARRLESGEGFEQTLGVARRIGTQLRDAQNAGRRLMAGESELAAVDPLIETLGKLSPYYSSRDPLLPRVMDRRAPAS